MNKKTSIILLIVIGFILYFNIFFNGFVWDDEEFIINNPAIQSVLNIPSFYLNQSNDIGGASFSNIYYRPVTSTFITLIYSLLGPTPFFFHLFQISFHIINAILIYLVFSYFFKKPKSLPFFLASIFLVHPANVEAIAWMSAIEVLFFLFGIVGFYLFLQKGLDSFKKSSLVFLFVLASFLTKETGIVFFAIIFFYYLLFEKKGFQYYFSFTSVILFLYLIIRIATNNLYGEGGGIFPIMNVSFLTRMMTVPKIVFYYISMFFFPKDLVISQQWVIKSLDINNFWIPLSFMFLFLLLCSFYIYKTKNKVFSFFFIWFCIGLLPHLQIIPLNMTVAERWLYFPIVGLLGMIAVIIQKVKVKLLIPIFIVLLTLLFVQSFIRTFNWRNNISLFSHDLKFHKDAFDLENNYGYALFKLGKIDEAGPHFIKSVKLEPKWWSNWNNLGAYYERKGNLKKAEECYKRSIDNSDYYLAYRNYASILIRQGKIDDAREFLEQKALPRFPQNKDLQYLYINNFESK
ncbi:MAG: hypothetical protein ABH812_01355 [bacterium]